MKTIVVILLFLFSSAKAQLVERTIIDSETGRPVPYASIKVMHKPFGEIASFNGKFWLQVTQTDTVLISSVGYQSVYKIGKELSNEIKISPSDQILKAITISTKRVSGRYILGNGASFINKKIKCKPTFETNNDCMRWGPGGAAEFAEPMHLPDSTKFYVLKEIILAVDVSACKQPFFLRVYDTDSTSEKPGTALFQTLISDSFGVDRNGKIRIPLSSQNIYFSNTKTFFVSISWLPSELNQGCATLFILKKTTAGLSYHRSIHSPNYSWSIFDGNIKEQKLVPGRFHTMFAAEVQALED